MRLLSLAFFFLLFPGLSAQPSSITQLGVEQGLSNNHVVSITQDKDGFLWFATEEGLNKFDGIRFTSFFKHTHDISGNELNYVLADENEPVIWIATQRDGLNAYNYVKDSLEVFQHVNKDENSLITNDVTAIAHSWDGNLWLSTYHRGVEYFDKKNKSFSHYNTATLSGLPSDNVWTVMDDQEGHLFMGHVSDGLSVLTLGSNLVKTIDTILQMRHPFPVMKCGGFIRTGIRISGLARIKDWCFSTPKEEYLSNRMCRLTVL